MLHRVKLLPLPLSIALLGCAFCVLTLQGLTQNLCQSNGCSLYQDVSLFHLSLWWYGLLAFGTLAVLAILGQGKLGSSLTALGLLLDSLLLILLNLTSPCTNCLVVALLLGLLYLAFRHAIKRAGVGTIFFIWLVLFGSAVFNLGVQAYGLWPIQDASAPTIRVFYSPSCIKCQEAVRYYSGHVDVAFYPVLEVEEDIAKIALMQEELQKGANMQTALEAALNAKVFPELPPLAALILRLHLLQNKAHVLAQGSFGVPYIEYMGLPKAISSPKTEPLIKLEDYTKELELEPLTAGQCQKGHCD
ncbi:MAG: hypothetical protein IJU79_02545 [Desulfovibrionaceae bacterium]|nr:hypothetical protein [Desulfovibrionaceae bacterium]